MSQLTLAAPEVKDTIDLFLKQARDCARPRYAGRGRNLGIAAMCTAFPCLLSVGEALARDKPPASRRKPYSSDEKVPTRVAIESFYPRMKDKSWLIPPDDQPCDDAEACKQLMEIRHGLAHAVSMPPGGISLIRRRQAAEKRPPGDWKIVVPAFVEAIKQTISEIREEQPDLDLSEVVKDRELLHIAPGLKLPLVSQLDGATASGPEPPSSTIWGKR